MSFKMRPSLTPFCAIFLFILIATSAAVSAQTRTSVPTTSSVPTTPLDFGIIGRGGSENANVTIVNIATNNSTVRFSITFTNVTNASGQLTATPSRGEIGPKSNMTVAVRLDVPGNATEGNYNASMVINESTVPRAGGNATILPAVVKHLTYTIQGNAPAEAAQSGVDVPLVAAVLGIATLAAIAAIYVIFKRT
jgi:hypothetical protein